MGDVKSTGYVDYHLPHQEGMNCLFPLTPWRLWSCQDYIHMDRQAEIVDLNTLDSETEPIAYDSQDVESNTEKLLSSVIETAVEELDQ
jgi:hypothetical protein